MTLQESKDLDYLISDESKRRYPSRLKTCIKYFNEPNMVFLGGGLPSSDYFPFDNISINVPKPPFKSGITNSIVEKDDKQEDVTDISLFKDLKIFDNDIPLSRSLQYSNTQGHPEFIKFLREHTEIVHDMKISDWDIAVSCGSTSAFESVLRIFCNPGDIMFFESNSFSSFIDAARGQNIKTFPIPIDEEGIIPEEFEKILNNWDSNYRKPKLLYTIPTGQNPTGSTIKIDRKKKIYKLAQEHDLIIIEDDPYYFLQLYPYIKDVNKREFLNKDNKVNSKDFLKTLEPTFLSLDYDGRVIRLDSFSKIFAPGVRLGWITTQKRFIEKFMRLHESTFLIPSGFSVSIITNLLNKWGQEGYLQWLINLKREYTIKRDFVIDGLIKNIPKELIDNEIIKIYPPEAGMFFIIKMNVKKHPEFKEKDKFNLNIEKFEMYMYEKFVKNRVCIVPGIWFSAIDPELDISKNIEIDDYIFFRGSFAGTSKELEKGLERIGETLKEEYIDQKEKKRSK